ncbi:MAG: lysophospholipid acyltransferase family protein [Gemmatimonadota bacterium]
MRLPVGPVALTAGVTVRFLGATWRFAPAGRCETDTVGRGRFGITRRLEPAIYALWHSHLLPLAVWHADSGAVVLTSRHRDGEVVTRVLERLGYDTERGSSGHGGSAGLRRMIHVGRQGRPLAFTPDGPTGPSRICKPGIVKVAAATGLPVIPVGLAASPAWSLSSWDRFLVPAPLATVYLSYGRPLRIPPEVRNGELRSWVARIGQAIQSEVAVCEASARRIRAGGARAGRSSSGERSRSGVR